MPRALNRSPLFVPGTGGTTVYDSGIPFVGISSGSVSAVGAITGITALPIAYPNAYCYFPANILATTIAAGWYYCTFSTTTAGTAFLNTYTSGMPIVPASPTAVVDGKGAYTGVTTEIQAPTVTIPAGTMGVSGEIMYEFDNSFTNSAGTKLISVRYSGTAGTVLTNLSLTTQLGEYMVGRVTNRGVTGVQVAQYTSIDYGGVARSASPVATVVDTTVDTALTVGMTRNTATDNYVLERGMILIRRAFTNG